MSAAGPTVKLIAAVASNGVVGVAGQLPWRLSADLKFLRDTTTGHSVIMGRKTWDSLPPKFRPLPGRRNIVLTRNTSLDLPGARTAPSLPAALSLLAPDDTAFVIGGLEAWAEALPLAKHLLLTEIGRAFDGDVRFPPWDRTLFRERSRQVHAAKPPHDFDFAFVDYQRIGS